MNFPNSLDYVCTIHVEWKIDHKAIISKDKGWASRFPCTGDACDPIQPLYGILRDFIPLLDASVRWSNVCLTSIRNHAFTKLIAQIINLRANHPEHGIKSIRMDNAAKFSSWAFDDYCLDWGITAEHIGTWCTYPDWSYGITCQEDKLIARLLLQNCNLPTSSWGHCSFTYCIYKFDELHIIWSPHCS